MDLVGMMFAKLALHELGESAIVEISDRLVDDYREELEGWFAEAEEKDHPSPLLYAVRRLLRAFLRKISALA